MAFYGVTGAIRDVIANAAAVSALTSSRIYALILPQNPTFPAVTINHLAEVCHDDISGCAGLFRADIQIDSWATTLLVAQRLDELIRLEIQGYSGTHLDVTIKGVYRDTSLDFFEEETGEYRQVSRYGVWYKRPNP